MGRGTSKAGAAAAGASGGNGAGMNSKNAMSLLNLVKRTYRSSADAVDTILNLINGAVIGTKIEFNTAGGMVEKYVKKTANQWAVTMGLKGQKKQKSTMVTSAVAKQIAIALYDQD